MTNATRPATIYDVARLAQVSHQTVTRYLAGFEGIRTETRARVEAAVRELDYRPNSAARLLRGNRVNRVAVLAQALDQSGPARTITGATAAAQRRGYVLDIIAVDGNDADSVDAALALATEHQVAGLLAAAQTEILFERIRERATTIPTVLDLEVLVPGTSHEVNEQAGRLAAGHLLSLGHRRMGYVSGPSIWVAAQARQRGFEETLRRGGGELAWVREGDWSAGSAFSCVSSLSPAQLGVTAIAAANDGMAIGVVSALLASGRAVPGDVSVIGTDDLPEARYLNPALSTVAMDPFGEGEYVMDKLLDLVEGAPGQQAGAAMKAPVVMARDSTGRICG